MTNPTFTPAGLEELLDVDAETIQVYAWRFEALERAGYTEKHARWMAEDMRIDLHDACQLIELGCAEETAYRILF